MKNRLILLSLVCAIVAGCGTPSAKVETGSTNAVEAITAEDRASISKISDGFGVAMKAGDWDTLAAGYTADAIMYPPDAPAVSGREEIKKAFAAFPPVKEFEAQIDEIEGYGDLAYLRGSATLTMLLPDGKEVQVSGKYIEIYKKQADGSWLMYRDIYNMDAPSGSG